MSQVLRADAPVVVDHRMPDRRSGSPGRAVVRLTVRLVRRGTILLAVAAAVWAGLEVATYRMAYPDGISPLQFELFEDNPAVRIMQGVPTALDTAGGFTVWDAGWMLQLIIGVWAVLTVTRLLRGDEDSERSDLVHAGPIRATRSTALTLATLVGATLVVGLAVTVTMIATDRVVPGAVLWGLGLALFGATFMSVGAVTSQLVEGRRRAAGLAATVLAAAYVIRMIGSSQDELLWLRWLTPMGWNDVLSPYGDPTYAVLLVMIGVPVALGGAALWLRSSRDAGAGVLGSAGTRPSRFRWLGGPTAFAWRCNRAVLLAWVLGLGLYAAIMGALVSTMIEWLAADKNYQDLMTQMGMGGMLSAPGFVALLASMLGLAAALQVSWRIGAARAEEDSGRVEALLTLPVSRVRWIGGHAVLALGGGLALLGALGTALWAGAAATGDSPVTAASCLAAAFNYAPVVVLIWGVALVTFGVVPRLTVAVPVAVTIGAYLLTMLGTALNWPGWVLDLSPFTHLALVPLDPWAATSGFLMLGLGFLLALVGLITFHRRDIAGA